MMGKGDFSRPSRRKTVNVEVKPVGVVLIDLEEDDDDSVIIIDDAPESFQRERGNSSGEGIINIDDDDDEDSSTEPVTRPDGDGELFSDASSSRPHFQKFQTTRTSGNLGKDKFEVKKKAVGFQFSKCKKTYSSTTPGRNRHGMAESDSSDSDCSDCEIIEDCLGKFSEQWERAAGRRKHAFRNRPSNIEDQGSASESNDAAQSFSRKERSDDQRSGGRGGDHSGNGVKSQPESTSVDADQNVEHEKPVSAPFERRTDFQSGEGSGSRNPHCWYDPQTSEGACSGIHCNGSKGPGPQGSHKPGGFPGTKNRDCCSEGKGYQDVYNGIPAFFNEKDLRPQVFPFMSFEQDMGDELSTPPGSSSKENEKLDHGQPPTPNPAGNDDMDLDNPCSLSDEETGCGAYPESPSLEKACHQDEVREEGVENKTESLQGKVGLSEGCIINIRENFKDTDEYKKAAEVEWAARQRELEIQSKEAQRLRKRRKAESIRLSDIEKRQKQRIEEIRLSQKKDAEDTNLKEHFRREITREIKLLEVTCIDMASLLRGLGIEVGGGFSPKPQDINAAYKQARLKFHPDRSAKYGIQQQVEAEEKFKLMSRMKDKFTSTPCR